MNRDLAKLAIWAAPVVFVLLWSTGFVVTRIAVTATQPFTWLTVRMAVTVCLMLLIVVLMRPVWPRGMQIVHCIVAGLLIQCVYLGGVSLAVAHAVPSGLSALIPGLQPILTSTLASRFLGEKVSVQQWAGLVVGLAGVLLVMHGRPLTGDAGWGWLASIASLLGITLGTLYQKRFSGAIDWRTGNVIQFGATGLVCLICALLFEPMTVSDPAGLAFAVGWSSLVLSVGSIGLLFWLIRRTGAAALASLFYLVPAVTAAFAYVLFGEKLDGVALVGMALCAAGVVIVNRRSATA